ncbi:MAG: 30S ribosomal protein S16 [Patescibacteria group bacterium]|jgi:small subunit ribosomal protein S16
MLKIRLARIGKKKKPTYRFIVSEAGRDTYGKALEILGSYNPFSKVCDVKKDRILYWISKGAQASPTAHNLLVDQNVISGAKLKASKGGKKKDAEVAAEKNAEGNAPFDSAQGASSAVEMAESKAEVKVAAETAEKPAEKVAENTEVKVEEKKEEKVEEKTEAKPAEPAA